MEMAGSKYSTQQSDCQQVTVNLVGFDCEFLEPPPDAIQTECPVCLQIIREPHQVTCCGNKFCEVCILQVKDRNKPCPTCNATRSNRNIFPDKGLKRILYSLKVQCGHQKDGCEWTGELGQLDEHLNTDPQPEKQLNGCLFVNLVCIYDCGELIPRQYVQSHQILYCTKRPFSCEHCHDHKSTFDDVSNNHWPVCGSYPVPCPNECGSTIQRQNIDSHVADECSLTTINCDFHRVGCAMKLSRQNMPEHLRANLLTHISLLATSHINQQAEITSLVSENTKLSEELAVVSKKLEAINPHASVPVSFPPILTMSNFDQFEKDKNTWYSLPVYTLPQGYKICLRVDSHHCYINVRLCFMKGECDEFLPWPFRGVIFVRLLDQVDGKDHELFSVVFSDKVERKYCSRVIETDKAKNSISVRLLLLNSLKPRYLHNNSICFQIYKVILH